MKYYAILNKVDSRVVWVCYSDNKPAFNPDTQEVIQITESTFDAFAFGSRVDH